MVDDPAPARGRRSAAPAWEQEFLRETGAPLRGLEGRRGWCGWCGCRRRRGSRGCGGRRDCGGRDRWGRWVRRGAGCRRAGVGRAWLARDGVRARGADRLDPTPRRGGGTGRAGRHRCGLRRRAGRPLRCCAGRAGNSGTGLTCVPRLPWTGLTRVATLSRTRLTWVAGLLWTGLTWVAGLTGAGLTGAGLLCAGLPQTRLSGVAGLTAAGRCGTRRSGRPRVSRATGGGGRAGLPRLVRRPHLLLRRPGGGPWPGARRPVGIGALAVGAVQIGPAVTARSVGVRRAVRVGGIVVLGHPVRVRRAIDVGAAVGLGPVQVAPAPGTRRVITLRPPVRLGRGAPAGRLRRTLARSTAVSR